MFVVLAGCHLLQRPQIIHEYPTGQPVDYYVSPWFYRQPLSRVVLVVPEIRDNSYEIQTRFAQSVADSLAQQGIFDIVLGRGNCNVALQSIRNGTFDSAQMLEIARRDNADGILFCEVNSFSAYEPMSLGCSLTLVDVRESIVTLHAGGNWDTTQENVLAKFKQHVCRIHECKQYAAGIYLKSPSEFFDFVSDDLAGYVRHIAIENSPPAGYCPPSESSE